ncbi:MAG: molecular chaperone TorD family protein [Rhodobacteraceae bacterium]|nr:molecular chaperone TorD family protein [Paracoccaceae bacterium]
MSASATNIEISEEDRLRADMYNFLGLLLARPPSKEVLNKTAELSGDDGALGGAINAMARVAKSTRVNAVESEFTALFIGLGRGELLPYTSFYLTGFLNEKPLAMLRKDMAGLRISRAPNVYEPEDNIASLLEMMGGMIQGRFGQVTSLDEQAAFFNKHIGSWAEHFFSDLEAAKSSVFYAPVGSAGKAFIEIEREAFRMDAA